MVPNQQHSRLQPRPPLHDFSTSLVHNNQSRVDLATRTDPFPLPLSDPNRGNGLEPAIVSTSSMTPLLNH